MAWGSQSLWTVCCSKRQIWWLLYGRSSTEASLHESCSPARYLAHDFFGDSREDEISGAEMKSTPSLPMRLFCDFHTWWPCTTFEHFAWKRGTQQRKVRWMHWVSLSWKGLESTIRLDCGAQQQACAPPHLLPQQGYVLTQQSLLVPVIAPQLVFAPPQSHYYQQPPSSYIQ
jgi:hypothetical protein